MAIKVFEEEVYVSEIKLFADVEFKQVPGSKAVSQQKLVLSVGMKRV